MNKHNLKLFISSILTYTFLSMGVTTAISAEVKIGNNELTCENLEFGIFEIKFNVYENVIDTEYYSDDNTPSAPSWDTLESRLVDTHFTTGKMFSNSGQKDSIKDVELKVLRYVGKGPSKGLMDVYINFPNDIFPVIGGLLIDHNHPKEYETNELGGQMFLDSTGSFAQLFFKCK